MSQAMHNRVQPHQEVRPCRMRCGNEEVPALQEGVLLDCPLCEPCRRNFEEDFKKAQSQRRRQQVRSSNPQPKEVA